MEKIIHYVFQEVGPESDRSARQASDLAFYAHRLHRSFRSDLFEHACEHGNELAFGLQYFLTGRNASDLSVTGERLKNFDQCVFCPDGIAVHKQRYIGPRIYMLHGDPDRVSFPGNGSIVKLNARHLIREVRVQITTKLLNTRIFRSVQDDYDLGRPLTRYIDQHSAKELR